MTARKICILGTSGSGKTTLARELAEKLGVAHIELDSLFHGPNWVPVPTDLFQQRLRERMSAEAWVMDGNYFKQAGLNVLEHADLAIWLDYSFALTFTRVFRRSMRRLITREVLWSGNTETFWQTFFTKESILWWVITTYRRRKRQIPQLFAQLPSLKTITFTSPKMAEEWIREKMKDEV